jgi:hypothetical protein
MTGFMICLKSCSGSCASRHWIFRSAVPLYKTTDSANNAAEDKNEIL